MTTPAILPAHFVGKHSANTFERSGSGAVFLLVLVHYLNTSRAPLIPYPPTPQDPHEPQRLARGYFLGCLPSTARVHRLISCYCSTRFCAVYLR